MQINRQFCIFVYFEFCTTIVTFDAFMFCCIRCAHWIVSGCNNTFDVLQEIQPPCINLVLHQSLIATSYGELWR